MIIFLYGEDSFRIREKIKEVAEKYKKDCKQGLDLKVINSSFDNSGKEFSNFENSLRQSSMFKEKKLLIIEDPFSNSLLEQKILKNKKIVKESNDVILIFKMGKVDSKNELAKFLKKEAEPQEFKSLEGSELDRWALKEIQNNKGKIGPSALKILIRYVGNDLWRLSQEINKLVNYKKGKEITEEDIKSLVKPEMETDIFKTIDAIAQKNKEKAISLLHEHLEKGDSVFYLLSMINYQFRNILMVKELSEKGDPYSLILQKSKLHPFVVKKSFSQARSFSLESLKKIYLKIFKADLDIKTGQAAPELALDMLVAEILDLAIFLVRRDFFLEAAFFLITPLLAALSNALYSWGKRPLASSCFFSAIKESVFLTRPFILSL